jgi:hypothetical protein
MFHDRMIGWVGSPPDLGLVEWMGRPDSRHASSDQVPIVSGQE